MSFPATAKPAGNRLNLVICGQSGQGIIMLSKTLLTAFFEEGIQATCTEYPAITHRFATTFSHIRVGEGVFSPRIRAGEVDLIIGLEPLECLKVSLIHGSPRAVVLTNDEFIRTDGVENPLLKSPLLIRSVEDVVEALRSRGVCDVVVVNATEIALRTVRSRSAINMVMLGASHASGRIPLSRERMEETVASIVPKGTAERNLEAFRAGAALVTAVRSRATIDVGGARP